MLYVKGTVLGTEERKAKGKSFKIIHVLEAFEKTEVFTNDLDLEFEEGELIDIRVKAFNNRYYANKQ